jgi:hypothetical protein
MLRSIIAVWTLALALVTVAALAGCGGVGIGPSPSPPDLATAPAATCAQSCDPCAQGEFCYQPSQVAQLPAFCARACTDDRDCAAGEQCASLFAALQPSVCVRAGAPVGCAAAQPNWHCDFPPASCKDDNTAQIPFSHADDRVCGTAFVHCANGCVAGACR